MKVKQLIQKLQKFDPEAEVVLADEYSEESTPLVVANKKLHEQEEGKFVLAWHSDYTR